MNVETLASMYAVRMSEGSEMYINFDGAVLTSVSNLKDASLAIKAHIWNVSGVDTNVRFFPEYVGGVALEFGVATVI